MCFSTGITIYLFLMSLKYSNCDYVCLSLLVSAKLSPPLKFHSYSKRYFPHHYTVFTQHKNESTQTYANVSLSINSFVLLLKVMEGGKHYELISAILRLRHDLKKTWGVKYLSFQLELCPETQSLSERKQAHSFGWQGVGGGCLDTFICLYLKTLKDHHFVNKCKYSAKTIC